MISFKGCHFPKQVILHAVHFYLRYPVSLRDLEEILSERRNEPAAAQFFAKASSTSGIPEKIVIDKSGANTAGIRGVNKILKRFGCPVPIATIRSKYLNNVIEQDHRFIKRRTRPMLGFKSFSSASATLEGIEVTHMIRKKQFKSEASGFKQFAALAG